METYLWYCSRGGATPIGFIGQTSLPVVDTNNRGNVMDIAMLLGENRD